MENVITLGKLIELIDMLFLFCLPLLSILLLKTPKIRGMTSLACNGNHFSSLVHAVFIPEIKNQRLQMGFLQVY